MKKNYMLAVIGCGLLALISALYYVLSRPSSRPTSQSSVTLAASSSSTATQTQSIVQPTVGPDNIVVGPKQMTVNPSVQATAPATNAEQPNSNAFRQQPTTAGQGCTTNDGQLGCSDFFSRRDHALNAEVDSSPPLAVLTPVRIADGFEKMLKPQLAGNTVQATEGNKLHRLLESELQDEEWANRIEQKVSRYVDSYLGQKRVAQDALVLHVVACGQTMCEVQVSISTNAMRNSSLDWQGINRQMVKDVLANEISDNSTLAATLSNGRAGFVSFYQRRKPYQSRQTNSP